MALRGRKVDCYLTLDGSTPSAIVICVCVVRIMVSWCNGITSSSDLLDSGSTPDETLN